MAVNYLQDYLGIDPNDYSAMEQGIAGISPLAPGQSIIPQAPVMPRASIMSEDDFASATAPLMNRVYQREAEGRERAEGLTNELQALQEEMAQTSEAEIQKRADLERQIQNIMQERDVSRNFAEDLENQIQGIMEELGVSRSEAENLAGQLETTTQERDASMQSAEGLATELQDVQANLQEITQLRDTALQNYQDAVAQQDIIRQQAAENQAIQLEEQRNSLLAEREGIITTLEQDFGVQRSELESVIGGLEGQVGDLTSKVGELESVRGSLEGQINDLSSQMQNLEVEKQDAIAQQDVIRAESAQAQQDALAQQGEQFATEKSALEQQIADLTAQVGQQQAPEVTIVEDVPPSTDVPGGGTPGFYDREPPPSKRPPQIFIDDGPGFRGEIIGGGTGGKPVQDLGPLPPSATVEQPPSVGGPVERPGGPVSVKKEPSPIAPQQQRPTARPPLQRDDIVPIPNQNTSLPVANPRNPSMFEEIERKIAEAGGSKITYPTQTTKPIFQKTPKMVPTQKPMSIGGVGGGRGIIGKNPIIGSGTSGIGARPDLPPPTTGGFKPFFGSKKPTKVPMKPPSIGGVGGRSSGRRMRPTFRAGGGAIGQAIADLQNRLR